MDTYPVLSCNSVPEAKCLYWCGGVSRAITVSPERSTAFCMISLVVVNYYEESHIMLL